MSSKTILLTGGTGHVGFAALIEALRQGYTVRAAVRSQAKAEQVRKVALSKPFAKESQLSFAVVPDITVSGAFDEAVKGVDGILHIASPIPSANTKDFEKDLIQPAIHGTTSILYSALKEPRIKKVVITSSVATILGHHASGERFDASTPTEQLDGPYEEPFAAYRASKARASLAVDAFIEEQKPQFAVAQILPGYVFGPNELAATTEEVNSGSNAFALAAPLGNKNDNKSLFTVVHVDDVAYLHVAALNTDPKYTGKFGATWFDASATLNDANDYVKKYFPESVKSGLLPANGSSPSETVQFFSTETEKVFGIKFKTFEEQIKDLVAYYVKVAK